MALDIGFTEMLESVAKSQYVWAIIALGLGFFVFKSQRTDSLRREQKLIDLYGEQKKDSLAREDRLMLHLEKTTEALDAMNDRLYHVEVKLDIRR